MIDAQDPRLELAARELAKLKPKTLDVCSSCLLPCATIPSQTPRRATVDEDDAPPQDEIFPPCACDPSHAGGYEDSGKSRVRPAQPICIYRLCEVLGVTVRFNNINMEGMYQRSVPPRIHLSALRPLPRRTYNCAHELGHHVFGHGSSIDELREDAKQHPWEDEKEFPGRHFRGFHADANNGSAPGVCCPRLDAQDCNPRAAVHGRLRLWRRLWHPSHAPISWRQHDFAVPCRHPTACHPEGVAG